VHLNDTFCIISDREIASRTNDADGLLSDATYTADKRIDNPTVYAAAIEPCVALAVAGEVADAAEKGEETLHAAATELGADADALRVRCGASCLLGYLPNDSETEKSAMMWSKAEGSHGAAFSVGPFWLWCRWTVPQREAEA
jgi:hypothetical protein